MSATGNQILERAVKDLGEHFDAVVILVSGRENGVTTFIATGEGNHAARYGMAREYCIREEARMVKIANEEG